MTDGICSADGCTDASRSAGMCNKHYLRMRKYGDPSIIKTNQGVPAEQRFWRFVEKTDGCWNWTSATSPRYGVFWVGGAKRSEYAHRYAYQLLVGPIPDGSTIDHLCENRLCVNPAHLEAVTPAVNTQRFWESRGHKRQRNAKGQFA